MADEPLPLRRLTEQGVLTVAEITRRLLTGELTVDDWEQLMQSEIEELHLAMALAGLRASDLPDDVAAMVDERVRGQRGYLSDFADELRAARGTGLPYPGQTASRATMYADAAGAAYWAAATRAWPLPAMPRDGSTQCLSRCRCAWRIDVLDERRGDADCYWVYGDTTRHCQTCIEREAQWGPLRVRGGALL